MCRSSDLLLSSKPSLERLNFIQLWDLHILWVILKCLISVCQGQNGSTLICDHSHMIVLHFYSQHFCSEQHCVGHRFGLSLCDCCTLNKNVFSFHHPPNGLENVRPNSVFPFDLQHRWRKHCRGVSVTIATFLCHYSLPWVKRRQNDKIHIFVSFSRKRLTRDTNSSLRGKTRWVKHATCLGDRSY